MLQFDWLPQTFPDLQLSFQSSLFPIGAVHSLGQIPVSSKRGPSSTLPSQNVVRFCFTKTLVPEHDHPSRFSTAEARSNSLPRDQRIRAGFWGSNGKAAGHRAEKRAPEGARLVSAILEPGRNDGTAENRRQRKHG